MKKFMRALAGASGAKPDGGMPQPSVEQRIAPDSILYSMPTIAMDELEFEVPTAASVDGAPQLSEDDWAQLEFFPGRRLVEIQQRLRELQAFEAEHRAGYGWTKIYARNIARVTIGMSVPEIARELDAPMVPAPILFVASRPLGQVKDGFSLALGGNAWLYGTREDQHVTMLGASLQGADNLLLSTAFQILNRRFGLILVDWQQQFVLVNVDDGGQFGVWRP